VPLFEFGAAGMPWLILLPEIVLLYRSVAMMELAGPIAEGSSFQCTAVRKILRGDAT
jgi:hypothetical protein